MATDAFQKASQGRSLNADEEFWWQSTGYGLGHLLAQAAYTPDQQDRYLQFHRRFILPSLGPRPVVGKKFNSGGLICADGSSLEPSINWKETDKSKRLIRFAMTATSAQAGTPADPFSQVETSGLLKNVQTVAPSLSLKHYTIFAKELLIRSQDQDALLARIGDDIPRVTIWVAFDLKHDDEPTAKVYFIPILKMLETGRHTNDLFYNAAFKCGPAYHEPINAVKSYIDSFKNTSSRVPYTELIALDCVEGPGARIKSYLRTAFTTLAGARNLYTLGGRITGEDVEHGLEALSQLWPILFRIPQGEDIENKIVWPGDFGLGASVELKPGKAQPEVKIHFPPHAIQSYTDRELAGALSDWFRSCGHVEFADSYESDLDTAL